MNDAPDSMDGRLETPLVRRVIKHIIWFFFKYDIEASITAWFSHAMHLDKKV